VCVSSRDVSCSTLLIRILVPPEVLRLKGQRGELGQTDCEFYHHRRRHCEFSWLAAVNFSEYDSLPSGQVSLINRVKYAPLVLIYRLSGWLDTGLTRTSTGVTQMWPRCTIPICSSISSPMVCQHTARHTEKSSQKGGKLRSKIDPFDVEEDITVTRMWSRE
jgi:hypothetical protein